MATPRIEIEYCTQCRFVLRAAWLAQEVLLTFGARIGEVALIPGSGGRFEVRLDEVLFSRHPHGRFPEPHEIKELIRDRIAPGMTIGHGGGERP
ncbi:MAG: SelT/SelW/SelH family protein [Gammaproteobacteria bacterium]